MKKKIGFILTLALVLFSIVLYVRSRAQVEAEKTRELRALKAVFMPLRFRITDRAEGTIRGEMQFYSLVMDDIDAHDMEYRIKDAGVLLAAETFALQGAEFFIDFLKYEEKVQQFSHPVYWVFPFRIYTDTIAPDNAQPIYALYRQGAFPAVYNSFDLDADAKQTLSMSYAEVTQQYGASMSDELKKSISGNAVHDLLKVAAFRLNSWYDVVVHTRTGNIEYIME
ncbi:hypothetical protein ACYULU_04850 [Breznakiellaceae bacterium SP9]